MSRPSPAPERPESIRFLALLAEASPRIGTGHVVELRNVARAALRRGVATELWLNSEAPPGLLEAAPCPVQVVADFSPDQLRNVASSLRARECAAALVSFWQIQNEQITALADFGGPVAVVDELGGVALPCDLVFNPSLVPELVAYTSSNPRFRVCGGPQYLPLGDEYAALSKRRRTIEGPIKSLVITMGGTDRSGATLNVVAALREWRPEVVKHVVLGAGFAHGPALDRILADSDQAGFVVHRNLPSLATLLAECDVALTAGGNTLYELACVGTPALVLYEDPHEERQGRAFAERGFGRCVGQGASATPAAISAALDQLEDPMLRRAFCAAGRTLVDGRGTERVLAETLRLSGDDSAV